jgi:hypothetical protein
VGSSQEYKIATKYKSKWFPYKGKEHLFFPVQMENQYTLKPYIIWNFTNDTIIEMEVYIKKNK